MTDRMYSLYKVVEVERAASGNTIVVVCDEKLDDRRWNRVPQAAKSFSQLIGVDLPAPVPVVSVENALDGAIK